MGHRRMGEVMKEKREEKVRLSSLKKQQEAGGNERLGNGNAAIGNALSYAKSYLETVSIGNALSDAKSYLETENTSEGNVENTYDGEELSEAICDSLSFHEWKFEKKIINSGRGFAQGLLIQAKGFSILCLQLRPDMSTEKNDCVKIPLNVACRAGDLEILNVACRAGDLEIVKQLLDASPSAVYTLNRDKVSALFIALSYGHSDLASELCSRMDFRACIEIGASCLQIAASNGFADIVLRIIVQNPSLATIRDENGFSPLHLASCKGRLGVIIKLLEKDPNLCFLKDSSGRTPLHLAMIYNQVLVVKEFLRERPELTSFNGLLLTELVNVADNNGDTILHLAAKIDCREIIEILLRMPGMKVDAANSEGDTALDILVRIGASDGVIDSYRRRMAIVKPRIARESADPVSLSFMQLKLILVAGLILTVSFQAVLSPPGGVWQDSVQGNHTNHIPGKAIQSEINPGLFTFFMASDALGFLVSLSLIPIIMILREEMMFLVNSLVVLALISIEVVFILSLIMISNREPFFRVEVFLLVLATLAGIGWTQWKSKRQSKCH